MEKTQASPFLFTLLQGIAAELSNKEVVFPTFVDVTMRIRQLVNDPNLNMDRIARVIVADPVLAARVIKLANSVAYNAGGVPIQELKSAALRIGLEALRNLMYSTAMDQLRRSKELVRFHGLAQKLWDHSLETAAIAHVLARKCARISPDKALFAGLVHDIGAFYLMYRIAQAGEKIDEAEAIPIIFEWHEEIGYSVLATMEMPEEVCEAVKGHDLARPVTAIRTLGDVIHLANRLAGLDKPWYPDAQLSEALIRETAQVDVSGCALAEVLEESRSEIEGIKAAFN